MSLPSVETVQKACEFIASVFRDSVDGGVFVQDLYDAVKVTRVYKDSENTNAVEFEIETIEKYRNRIGMVHGGASSTFVSLFTVLALAADSKYWSGSEPTEAELKAFFADLGVTRSVEVQVLKAVPLNAKVYARCHVINNTKSNATITIGIFGSNGTRLVNGVHDMMKKAPNSEDPNDPKHLRAYYVGDSKL